MTTAPLAPTAPVEIRRVLARIAARWRRVEALGGLGALALVASLGAVAAMVADFAWPLSSTLRWSIWAAWLGVSALVGLLAVVRPLLRPLSPLALAALAERDRPELGEGLIGSVALLVENQRTHGSPALIAALVGQAARQARAIDPARAVPAGRGSRRLAVGLAVVAIVAMPAVLRPDPFGILARRFLMPWVDLDRVAPFSLRVAPGDRIVAIGSDLNINAWLSRRFGGGPTPDAAVLEWDDPETKQTRRVRMATKTSPTQSAESRLFEARIPRVAGSIRYRVTTGSVASRRFAITAVAPPALASLTARVESPAYTKLPPSLARDPSRIEAIEGSVVTLTLVANRPVDAIEVAWPSFGATDESHRRLDVSHTLADATFTARAVAESPGSYAFTTQLRRDGHGLDGPEESRRLTIRADAPPRLSVRPVEAREASPDDVLTVPIVARDDFAIASAELHYTTRRMGSEETEPRAGKIDAALDGLGTPRASGEAALGLKSLDVNPGDVLTYRVKVTDNRPAPKGPNVVWSAEAELGIVAKAEPLLARRDRLHRERVAERLEAIKTLNLASRHEATQLRYAADAARRNPPAWDAEKDATLAARETASRKVVDDLNALARDLDADATYRPLARPTKQVAEVEADAARVALDESRRAADPDARLVALRAADARLGAVHGRIEELQQQLDALAKLDDDRRRLRELAAQEDALAAQAREAGDDRPQLDALRADQDAVRQELDALANKSPELKAGLVEAQAKEAADLAEKARALAARQRDEARRTAENARPDATLKALAEAQRQIEIDARRLALDVDEPLAENGRGRLNIKAIQEAVIPIERGEIAPGRQKLDEAENALRRLARDLEDAPNDPKALARRLLNRQDALARQVAESVRETKGKASLDPKEQATLAQAIKPMIAEQEAIARLAAAIQVDEPRKAIARDASQAVGRALENLRSVRPRESEARQNEARQALNRLADALPDPWNREEPARRKLEEARRIHDEATRDLDRHLRETAPQAGKPHDAVRAALDLAGRLAPLAKRESEAAEALAALDAPARVDPQRRRAERRARALAAAMESIQKEAATLPRTSTNLVAIKEWRIAAPFPKDARTPFPLNREIDKSAQFKGKNNKAIAWKPEKALNDRGWINLGALYGEENDASAFASAEIVRPEAGTARFAIGSDDTMIVWVNGTQVFKYDGNRGYGPEQDSFEAALLKGLNRVVVRCGNGSNAWAFGVEVAPPRAVSPELARIETLREALPQAAAEARAALERLTQKAHGDQTPADDAAEELAVEQSELSRRATQPETQSDPASRREAADTQHRIATALRNLAAPDAPALQAEAVRLTEAAAKALDAPKADAAPAQAEAAAAVQALSDRLNDAIAPRAEAAALAKAERALNGPDAPRDPSAQARQGRAIAAQAARLQAEAKETNTSATHAADLAERVARGSSSDPNMPTTADVASARSDAAARLDALAARSSPEVAAPPTAPRPRALPDAPRDPDVAALAPRAAEAKALARRERQLRERLQSILGERVGPQEALRHEAAALGREFAELRDRSHESSPRAQGPARTAADLLTNHATAVMEQSANELAQGRPDSARESQRRAAEVVERAAHAAEDLTAALKSDRPAHAEAADLQPARDALADARRHLATDRNDPAGPTPGADAAQAMQRAAQAMRAAARSPASKDQNQPGQEPALASEGATLDPKSAPAGVAPADLTALQTALRQKTGRVWGELPGHLRTEILQRSQGKYRDDYARLIQLYFQEIAADGSDAKP